MGYLLKHKSNLKNQRGVTIVIVAIMLTLLFGFVALAIDIGYLMVTRNELQNVADSSALAATRQLGVIYQGMTYSEQQTYNVGNDNYWDDEYSNDRDTIISVAQETALSNVAAGKNINILSSEIVFGDWDGSTLTPTTDQPNGINVTARRDGSANGPISTFFANIIGIDTLSASATATAALTPKDTSDPGEVELPIGISRYWFDKHSCNQFIAFSPTNDPYSCAGWNNWDLDHTSNSQTLDILDNIIRDPNDPDYEERFDSPEIISGETNLNYIGGNLSQGAFDSLLTAFQNKGYDISGYDEDGIGIPITDADGNPIVDATGQGGIPICEDGPNTTPCDAEHTAPAYYPDGITPRNLHVWPTSVPVYDWPDCQNPNTTIVTLGFAEVEVQDVIDAGGGPDTKIVRARVLWEYVEPEEHRGGGGLFGPYAPIPNLVQ